MNKLLILLALFSGLTYAQYSPDTYCADAGASDSYACNLVPSPAAYVIGQTYYFKANTANTGAATISFNSLAAITIVKVAGGVPTTLANNDIRVGQVVVVTYDGTNMQMQSTLGNAPATVTIAATTATLAGDGAGNAVAVTGTGTNCVLVNGTSSSCGGGGGGTAGSPLAVQTSSVTVTSNAETSLIGTVAGSLTIPANWFATNGTVLEVCASGVVTTAAAAQGTLQFKLKMGSTVVAQTATFTPTASLSNNAYDFCTRLTARTVGAMGTIMASNIFPLTAPGLATPDLTNFTNPTPGTAVTVDTTSTQAIDLTSTFSANATNSITQTNFYMVSPGSVGRGVTLTAPVSGDWTAFGTGMAQAPTFASSRFTFVSSKQTTDKVQGITHAIPSAPWTRYFRVWPLVGNKAFSGISVGLADGTAGTPGKIVVCGVGSGAGGNGAVQGTIAPAELSGGNYTNTTTFSTSITLTLPVAPSLTVAPGRPTWFKLVDDNTNWTCSYSTDYDGVTDSTGNWLTVWSETRNTFATATLLVVVVNGYANGAGVVFDSYK